MDGMVRGGADGQLFVADVDVRMHLCGVGLQVSKLAEGLATSSKAAHERLDLIVDPLMGLQVAKLSKGLVAARVRALVGTLSGMLALVSLEIAELGECTVASMELANL